MQVKTCPKCGSPKVRPGIAVPNYFDCRECNWIGNSKEIKWVNVPMPYISIDIETTGLDQDTCQVLELGAVIEDWLTPVEKLPTFRRKVIYQYIQGEPYALRMNAQFIADLADKPTPSQYNDFVDADKLGVEFRRWLGRNNIDSDHVQAAGKNFGSFDLQFLRKMLGMPHFKHRCIDPGMLFWRPLEDSEIPNSKVCMERAGITGEVAHTAVEDALAVVKMMRFIVAH